MANILSLFWIAWKSWINLVMRQLCLIPCSHYLVPQCSNSPFASSISLLLHTSPFYKAFNRKAGLHSHGLFKFIMSDLFKCNECIINFHYKFRTLPLFLPLGASFSFQQLPGLILHSLRNSLLLSSFQISHHKWLESGTCLGSSRGFTG